MADDKTALCIPLILERLRRRSDEGAAQDGEARGAGASPRPPLVVGLNGVQGIGKTTLVQGLATGLRQLGLETVVVSVDDFYLPRARQRALAASQPGNLLVQCRGEPGTHDVALIKAWLEAIRQGQPTKTPRYDKSAWSGEGDRCPESEWLPVNEPGKAAVQVVIFEGWCVGFRSLSEEEVARKWNGPSRSLRRHALDDVLFINQQLSAYDDITDSFDLFIHLDAEKLEWVYDWRLEQERKLRQEKGAGMTDEQVNTFVDAYFPAYELYSDKLREGLFTDKPGCQLTLVIGRDRMIRTKFLK